MTRFVCAIGAILLLGVSACGGSEEATPGGYADTCSAGDDCEEGLECVASVCTTQCLSDADCKKHSGSSICASNSRCYEPCNDTNVCKRFNPDLVCNQVAAQQGTCRAQ